MSQILVKILSMGKYSPKTVKKGQIWGKMLEMPQKSNFMPKSQNFSKICKNMLDQVGLILLRIF